MSPPAVEEHDRRRFFRIDERVALRYRAIATEDLDTEVRRLQLGYPDRIALASAFASTSAQMRSAFEKVRRDLPDVATILEGLNDKLDLLVQLMAASDNELADHPTHNVNLSASGMSFDCEEALEPGTAVEIKLLMFPSYVCILCFGEVVHRESIHGGYRVGVDFSHIRENDRELIVQHVTRRQSEVLREARAAIDGIDEPPGDQGGP